MATEIYLTDSVHKIYWHGLQMIAKSKHESMYILNFFRFKYLFHFVVSK